VPGIRSALYSVAAPVIAVSPIIAGQTVKGPAAKMYAELGIEPSARSVANHYGGLLRGFVLDNQDSHLAPEMASHLELHLTDTLMKTPGDRLRLAGEVLELGSRILG